MKKLLTPFILFSLAITLVATPILRAEDLPAARQFGDLKPEENVKKTMVSYPADQKFFLPQKHQYHQILTMKLFTSESKFDGKLKRKDNGKSEVFMNYEQALEMIRRMDHLTLAIPKIVYLVAGNTTGTIPNTPHGSREIPG